MRARLTRVLAVLRLKVRVQLAHWLGNAFNVVALPTLVALLLRDTVSPASSTRLVVGAVLFSGAMATMRATGNGLALNRFLGRLELFSVCGVTRTDYLAASLIELGVFACLPLVTLAVLLAASDVGPPAGWSWLLAYAVGTLSFWSIGVWAASVATSVAGARFILNVLAAAVFAFFPVLYPLSDAPASVVPLVRWLPPTVVVEALEAAWVESRVVGPDLFAAAGWAALLVVVAHRRFPWGAGDAARLPPAPLEGAPA